jgi:hypothetical protein
LAADVTVTFVNKNNHQITFDIHSVSEIGGCILDPCSMELFILTNVSDIRQVIEGKIKGDIEVTRRRGRRRKGLLDDLKDRRGYSHLKEEALDRTMWRNRFRGGFGPVVRQNSE